MELKRDDIDKKYKAFQNDIKDYNNFSEKIKNLFLYEIDNIFEDILITNETDFISSIQNGVEMQLTDMYSEYFLNDKNYLKIFEQNLNYAKNYYKKNYNIIKNAKNFYESLIYNNSTLEPYYLIRYRKHCCESPMYAHHSCERKKPNKFLIITENIEEFNEKQEILFVYCYLCNKVYKSNYFYAYCIICNTSYFSNILKKDENPNLLPATWSKYHCEQIINDKMKCIKCKKILYLNLETKMLECQNKNCGFESKPSRILWTCNHCKTEFKSDAIVFNPLELENIKKVVKQTLQTKHKAHPNRMPCCKINTFFTPFYHKKDCPGILYVGDFNNKIIIVCEKCKAINFYDRFIWTCPKCGTRFRDKKSHTRKEPLLLKFDSKKNKNVDNEENNENNNLQKSQEYKNNNNNIIYSPKNEEGKSKSFKVNIRKYNSIDEKNNIFQKNNVESNKNNNILNNKILSQFATEKTKENFLSDKKNINSRFVSTKSPDIKYSNNYIKKNIFMKDNIFTKNQIEEKKKTEDERKEREMRILEKREQEKIERQKREKEREERERKIIEEKKKREEKERKEREEKERKEREEKEKRERERKEREKREKIEKERKEREKIEKERKEREKEEKERKEKEEKEKREKRERERKEREKREKEEKERREKEEQYKKIESKKSISSVKTSENSENNSNKKNSKDKYKINENNIKKNNSNLKNTDNNNNNNSNNNKLKVELIEEDEEDELNELNNGIINFGSGLQADKIKEEIKNILAQGDIPEFEVEEYTLFKQLGEGSYGVIYSVYNNRDHSKKYAMKKIIAHDLDELDGFHQEFEFVASCNHPNIMKIYGVCVRFLDVTTFALYVLMEMAINDWDKEIKEHLKIHKLYKEEELIFILKQLTSALKFMQVNKKIAHRDIKPQNILIFETNNKYNDYKVADFGEAKEVKISKQLNTLRGTELYMSPALYNGLKDELDDVTHNPYKSDVFSLGFCFIYAACLNFNIIYELRDIKEMNKIEKILHKNLKNKYTEKFIKVLALMLEIDENKRVDFEGLENYLNENFNEEEEMK